MNFIKRFDEVKAFLNKHIYIFELEVLKRYPDKINEYYLNLSKNLIGKTDKELAEFESEFKSTPDYSEGLNTLLDEICTLIDIEPIKIHETKLHQNLKRKLNPKKLHELSTLKTFFDQSRFNKVFDIGGGIGHLSNVFVYGVDKKANSIDMNREFQDAGVKKISRWLIDNKNKVGFTNFEVNGDLNLDLDDRSIIAGLHSCGKLSNDLIDCFKKNNKGGLINFGCCYHKLESNYNLSKYSQKNPLKLSNNALHLATRSFAYTNEEDVKARRMVKYYRYGLHHLGLEYFNDGFITLGNGTGGDYSGSFSDYVYKYYPKAKELSKEEIESFYQREDVQNKITENFYLDFIRGLLGRVIEVYLLLDRVIYLSEDSIEAKIYQVFDRKLSPRNIAIIVD